MKKNSEWFGTIRRTACLGVFVSLTCVANADTPPSGYWSGDVNGSSTKVGSSVGEKASAKEAGINIEDVALLIDMLRGVRTVTAAADVDGNKLFNRADVVMLIDIILGKKTAVWRNSPVTVDGEGSIGDGGNAGETPPPADSKKR